MIMIVHFTFVLEKDLKYELKMALVEWIKRKNERFLLIDKRYDAIVKRNRIELRNTDIFVYRCPSVTAYIIDF
jgi:hypothetical protein